MKRSYTIDPDNLRYRFIVEQVSLEGYFLPYGSWELEFFGVRCHRGMYVLLVSLQDQLFQNI